MSAKSPTVVPITISFFASSMAKADSGRLLASSARAERVKKERRCIETPCRYDHQNGRAAGVIMKADTTTI
ncbi:hypothetical protein D3C72_2094920 [compost metagenome]